MALPDTVAGFSNVEITGNCTLSHVRKPDIQSKNMKKAYANDMLSKYSEKTLASCKKQIVSQMDYKTLQHSMLLKLEKRRAQK